jgi:hypothetical protein
MNASLPLPFEDNELEPTRINFEPHARLREIPYNYTSFSDR